ncbi:ABC transporter ATP-binding protein [Curvibacter sp. HBC28]|uniref:ABC transporter ATP-binding protein n=1 Tax=Curvibacter microcysteis TaxID=3026419 RepID=A0ABT5MNU5_9BURK|nr:ABC transporter ATP-binding protein [Curvibacter sp. HBC28]MDD0816885.1 ABC transporter ATP-binding protein [Curvibacter sp. HBC28]
MTPSTDAAQKAPRVARGQPPAAVELIAVGKHYGTVPVFQNVSFQVAPGEFVAIVGDSGVGKSTLLNCLAGLDHWDRGRILVHGTDLASLDDNARALWRRAQVGFVFQAFHVLPHLDVAQNVALPLMLLGQHGPDAHARVQSLLDTVGLGGLGSRLPQQLSGGQLQRVAMARALVHRPGLLLADEPTGNLDPDTAQRILDVLQTQSREQGAALVLVTHSETAAARADRVLRLRATGIENSP